MVLIVRPFMYVGRPLAYLLVFQGLICKLTLETQGGSKAVGERAEQIWIYSGMGLVSLFNGG
jgi:hypothetical protein